MKEQFFKNEIICPRLAKVWQSVPCYLLMVWRQSSYGHSMGAFCLNRTGKAHLLRHSLSGVNSDTQVVLSDLKEIAGILGCCQLLR